MGRGDGHYPAAGQQHRTAARADGRGALTDVEVATIRSRYAGAIARGWDENTAGGDPLHERARILLWRFPGHRDVMLRFTVNLDVPFTNNTAELPARSVKLQQRTSGGCWRTLQGLCDFAVVQSSLSTATKWGIDTLEAMTRLFTIGPWLPPTLTPEPPATSQRPDCHNATWAEQLRFGSQVCSFGRFSSPGRATINRRAASLAPCRAEINDGGPRRRA